MTKQWQIILIAHNLRSCHNVGSILRTAEGMGISEVILSGYTPYPIHKADRRLPHEAQKIHRQISKTSLGAEEFMKWRHIDDVFAAINELKQKNVAVYALEQTPTSQPLTGFSLTQDTAIIVGREVEGVESEIIAKCDGAIQIPMAGRKESFNVAQAAAMSMYQLVFGS